MTTPEKNVSLYEIVSSIQALESLMSDEEFDATEYLDAVDLQLSEKVDNIVKFNKHLELTEDALNKELDRLGKYLHAVKSRRVKLVEYVKYTMEKHGLEKLETKIARISFRKSTMVVIDDKEQLPAEFIKVKTIAEPDKLRIKAVIEAGDKVPGAHIEENHNLQIK